MELGPVTAGSGRATGEVLAAMHNLDASRSAMWADARR